MSLNLPDNDPFQTKQPIRTRRRKLQESSRLRQQNSHPELQALPSLKGTLINRVSFVFNPFDQFRNSN